MKHFTLEQWADFARNVLKEKDKTTMQDHLQTGCKACTKALAMWTRVNEVAHREGAFQPLEASVRVAKGLLAIHARPGKVSVAELIFDSFQTPAMAGVRSTAAIGRQLLYGHGNYRIDLRMEPRFDSDTISLVGQVLNSASPADEPLHVPVTLWKGRKVLAKSMTNEFGEFQLECDLKGPLQMQVDLPEGMPVRIPLVELSPRVSASNAELIDSRNVSFTSSQKNKRTSKRV